MKKGDENPVGWNLCNNFYSERARHLKLHHIPTKGWVWVCIPDFVTVLWHPCSFVCLPYISLVVLPVPASFSPAPRVSSIPLSPVICCPVSMCVFSLLIDLFCFHTWGVARDPTIYKHAIKKSIFHYVSPLLYDNEWSWVKKWRPKSHLMDLWFQFDGVAISISLICRSYSVQDSGAVFQMRRD